MSREIIWFPEALRDLDRLRAFIREHNPAAARRAANRIKDAVNILRENPEAGIVVEDPWGYRDLIIPFGVGNYILRYREDNQRIIVLKIWHNKEDH
jgi:plasmid stabilization system protein ParE